MTDAATALLREVRVVCDVVTATLGPSGANQLIVEENGTVTHTASGARVLETLELETPAADLLRAAATGFRERHHDGATSVVGLAGALLEAAESLREDGLHPTVIEGGYRLALEAASERARAVAVPVDDVEPAALARTALTGVRDPGVRSALAADVAAAVATVADAQPSGTVDPRDIAVVTRVGGSLSDTELIRGVVLDASPVEPDMPRHVEGGLGLISTTVDLPRLGSATSRRASLQLSMAPTSFEERREIGERERERFAETLDAAVEAGCTVLLSSNAVNDRIKRQLANRGLLALQRVDDGDLRRLARVTGGSIVPALEDLEASTLGDGTVEVRRVAGRDMTFVRGAGDHPVYTLFCRSPDPRSLEEFSSSVEAAVSAVATARREGTVVAGGGAIEMAASTAVREAAPGVTGREQLAVEAFAEALEALPSSLARTGGLDVVDALLELRSRHAEGQHATGIDAVVGVVDDLFGEEPVIQPTGTTLDAWAAATDLAVRLLRIDERLPATDLADEEDDVEDELLAGED